MGADLIAFDRASRAVPRDGPARSWPEPFGAAIAVLGGVILLGIPLLDAEVLRARLWAFDHLRDTPLAFRLAWTALLALAAWPGVRARALGRLESSGSMVAALRRSAARRALVVLCAACAFLALALGGLRQRNFELGDSAHLIQFLTLAVHTQGLHVTYDEPVELLVHSVAYRAMHAWIGASVGDAYALLSALAGLGCAAALVAFWRRRAPGAMRSACGVALVASTATAQLFFGYVENYALVTLGLVVYVWLAGRVLDGRSRLSAAAVVLGVCISLHVLAGWLLPSLAYLARASTRGLDAPRRARVFALCGASLLAPPAATVTLLTALGVPLASMGTTHLAQLKFIFRIPAESPVFHYPAFSAPHLRDVANEWLLVSLPGALTISGALFAGVRHDAWRDPMSRLLALGAVSTHLFAATWNSDIGAYRDWDLFSIAGVFDALLGAYLLLGFVPSSRDVAAVATPILVLACGLSGSWVVSNAHRVVEVPSHHEEAHLQAGLLERWAGNEAEARRDFEEVVQINARNGRALFELGTSLWNAGDRQNALPLLLRFLEVEPGSARAAEVRRALDASRAGQTLR